MTQWAKLYTDILGDPKLMRAARKGARELVYLPWLIAFAKLANDDGRLTVGGEPADPVDISDLIPNATARAVASALSALERIGVLEKDGDALRFTKWEARSGSKPSDAPTAIAERVRRHREKVRNASGSEEGNAVSNAESETPSNALQGVTGNATEERREEEGEKEKEPEKKEPSPRAAGRKARPTWLTPYGDAWKAKFGGEMPYGPAATALAPLRDEWGDAETLRRWVNYLAVATPEYVNPARFASTWNRWNHAALSPAPTNGHRPSKQEAGRAALAEWLATQQQGGAVATIPAPEEVTNG